MLNDEMKNKLEMKNWQRGILGFCLVLVLCLFQYLSAFPFHLLSVVELKQSGGTQGPQRGRHPEPHRCLLQVQLFKFRVHHHSVSVLVSDREIEISRVLFIQAVAQKSGVIY